MSSYSYAATSRREPRPHALKESGQQTVLIALTPEEFKLFLPGFAPEKKTSSAARYHWLDTTSLDACRWHEALEHYRPSVLMAGWSTPTVPELWAIAPGAPLRYICQITGGVRHVAPRTLIEHGLIVTNWGSLISHTVAEHAMLLVLGSLRSFPLWRENMEKSSYGFQTTLPSLRTRTLRGKRVGLHGFGAIARELVQMLKPYHVHLSAYSAPVPRSFMEGHGVAYCASIEELFSKSDVLIECESLTPASKGSVTEDILRLLPEDAVFVNVGRARLTDEAALIRLAQEKRIRVAVDVFDEEPQPADSPWLQIPTALLSPHIAGPTQDVFPECGKRALENIERFLTGKCVHDPITLSIYDMAS